MKCPIDNVELVMSERQGIEIDYCPQCRGVWLDRGELDKIIERSTAREATDLPHRSIDERRYPEPRRDERDDQRKPYRKRESFLGELFDFD